MWAGWNWNVLNICRLLLVGWKWKMWDVLQEGNLFVAVFFVKYWKGRQTELFKTELRHNLFGMKCNELVWLLELYSWCLVNPWGSGSYSKTFGEYESFTHQNKWIKSWGSENTDTFPRCFFLDAVRQVFMHRFACISHATANRTHPESKLNWTQTLVLAVWLTHGSRQL